MNGYDQVATATRRGRKTVVEASGDSRSDGKASQTRDGNNRYDTSTPEKRRKALASARRSGNPADEAQVRRQMQQEANSTIDALMLGLNMDGKPMARRDNRAKKQGGYRQPTTVAEVDAVAAECGMDPFAAGYMMGRSGGMGTGDWDHDHMDEAKKLMPPWLQKGGDGSDSSSGDSDSGSRGRNRRGRRGKVAESALNPQIRFRETVNDNGFDEAELNADKRNDLPGSAFAGPDRSYPIDTEARARSAIARVKANGSPSLQRQVIAAVKRRYPDMDVEATSGEGSSDSKKS